MKKALKKITTFMLLASLTQTATAETFHIYLDADQSINKAAGEAIFKGIHVGLKNKPDSLKDVNFIIKKMDHRGNTLRTKMHIEKFLKDDKALVLFGGMHSSNLIKNRNFINEKKALTLVPWAAAGPITRAVTDENWIFRLSIDDSIAGTLLADYALNKQQCKKPAFLLENTPWGDSNLKTLSQSYEHSGLSPVTIQRFPWGINRIEAESVIKHTLEHEPDCIIMVANTPEGVQHTKAIQKLAPANFPIISHWGITGGNFTKKIKVNESLNLHFIQTCYSFLNKTQNDYQKNVWRLIQNTYPNIKSPEELEAPTGFIHAYDLTKILFSALEQVNLKQNIKGIRTELKNALINNIENAQGLVKTYNKPFNTYTLDGNQHEALDIDDYCMGEYLPNGAIKIREK